MPQLKARAEVWATEKEKLQRLADTAQHRASEAAAEAEHLRAELAAATLAKQMQREEEQVKKLEKRSQDLALKILAKDDYGQALALSREIDAQEAAMEKQWCADRKLAKQLHKDKQPMAKYVPSVGTGVTPRIFVDIGRKIVMSVEEIT